MASWGSRNHRAGESRRFARRDPTGPGGVSSTGSEKDPYALYDTLCRKTGVRHDPCVIDVFIASVRFMEGAPAAPWWAYTAERKRTLEGGSKVTIRSKR